jgi:hypothetical protein
MSARDMYGIIMKAALPQCTVFGKIYCTFAGLLPQQFAGLSIFK